MQIGNLIANNIINVNNNVEISNLLMSNPEYMQMLSDKQMAYLLMSNALLFAGTWGTFEASCETLLRNVIKQNSQKYMKQTGVNALVGSLPAMHTVLANLPDAQNFKKLLLHQAKMRMSLYNWSIKADKFEALSTDDNASIQTFEFLNNAVGVLLKKETKGEDVKYTKTLITRSLDLIAAMDALHMIAWGEKQTINDLKAKVWGADQDAALFTQGKAWVIHMRCTRVIYAPNGSRLPLFEVTTSRGRIPLTVEKTATKSGESVTYITPLSMVYAEERILKEVLSGGVCTVVKTTDFGDKERKVTSNPNVVLSLYKDVDPAMLQEKIVTLFDKNYLGNKEFNAKVTTGFDIAKMHHYFVDVESSVHSPMTWGIRPGAWKTIVQTPANKVVTKYHNIDFYLVNQILTSRVLNARKEAFDCLPGVLGISSYKYGKEKRKAVMDYCNTLSEYEVYDFITNSMFEPLFGNVQEQLVNRARNRRKYLKNFTAIDLTNKTPEEVESIIKYHLKNGVVHLALSSMKYGRYELMATTNKQVLANTYGKDYLLRFGSPIERLDFIANAIQAGTFNAEMFADSETEDRLPDDFLTLTSEKQLEAISVAMIDLNVRRLDVKPGTLFYKVADGYNITDDKGNISIHRTCNVINIIAAAYTTVEQ